MCMEDGRDGWEHGFLLYVLLFCQCRMKNNGSVDFFSYIKLASHHYTNKI